MAGFCQALLRHRSLGLDELLLHPASVSGVVPLSRLVDRARSSCNKALDDTPSGVSMAADKAINEPYFEISRAVKKALNEEPSLGEMTFIALQRNGSWAC